MAAQADTGERPDVHEMVIIHRWLRREFTILPGLVTSVPAGDTGRAKLIAGHARALLDALHVHHSGEDELLWPKLLDRASPSQDLVARMQAQHEGVAAATGSVRDLLDRWEVAADPSTGRQLAGDVQAMREALFTHLNEEESAILPLAAEHLSAAEWEKLGEHGVSHTPRNQLLLLLGQILEDTSDAERRAFLAKLPLPPRLLWAITGRRQYRRYTRRIRGQLEHVLVLD
jgi:hemerythrin-like domain-containing protein